MPDIKFNCPECGKHLVVDERGAGMTLTCTDCGKPIVIPNPNEQDEESGVSKYIKCINCGETIPDTKGFCPICHRMAKSNKTSSTSRTINCPSCGKTIPKESVICTNCGINMKTRTQVVTRILDKTPAPSNQAGEHLKKCPFCAETIQYDAIKCKHCGEHLHGSHRVKFAIPVLSKGKIGVLVIVIITILCGGGYLIYRNHGATKTQRTASLSGEVWLTQTSGESYLLRGKQIYLLPSVLVYTDELEYWLRENMRSKKDEWGLNLAIDILKKSGSPTDQIFTYSYLWAGMANYYYFQSGHRKWTKAISNYIIKSAYANSNGQYQMDDISPGTYYIFTSHDTGNCYALWFIEVNLQAGSIQNIDLFNDTANYIVCK